MVSQTATIVLSQQVTSLSDLNDGLLVPYNSENQTKALLNSVSQEFSMLEKQAFLTLQATGEELALKGREIAVLKGRIEENDFVHRREIEALQRQVQTLQEHLERERAEKNAAKEETSSTQDALNGAQRVNNELRAQMHETNLMREKETVESQKKEQALRVGLSEKENALKGAQEELAKLQVALANSQRENHDLRTHSQTHQSLISSNQQNIKVLEGELTKKRNELDEAQRELKRLQASLDKIQGEYQGELAHVAALSEAHQKELVGNQQELNKVRVDLQNAMNKINELRTSMKIIKTDLSRSTGFRNIVALEFAKHGIEADPHRCHQQ
jgi:chromosome segregation ATPase